LTPVKHKTTRRSEIKSKHTTKFVQSPVEFTHTARCFSVIDRNVFEMTGKI